MLAGEVKSIKQQMQTLLQKGHNDDELIAALMVSSGLAQNGMEWPGTGWYRVGWNGLEQDLSLIHI